jgi:leader peptidase (prepilin peptidase)/N-methyltransferase
MQEKRPIIKCQGMLMESLPTWFFFVCAAAVGLELGGLATIFIQRWIDERPILRPGRSVCPSCGHGLGWRDTIPLLSYLLLRGRCRHCRTRIGSQYLLVEVSCLAWSLALAHHFGPTPAWGVHLVLGCMLVAGSFIDFETFMLPDRITLGGTALALVAGVFLPEPGWRDSVAGALCGGGFFWLLQRAYRLWRGEEGLGTGDVKLMCMIGAVTGLTGLPLTILAAACTSGLGIAVYVLRTGAGGLKTRIPFGPFLSLGCMLYVLYGEPVMRWWNTY